MMGFRTLKTLWQLILEKDFLMIVIKRPDIQKYFFKTAKVYIMGTMLDPRYKLNAVNGQ